MRYILIFSLFILPLSANIEKDARNFLISFTGYAVSKIEKKEWEYEVIEKCKDSKFNLTINLIKIINKYKITSKMLENKNDLLVTMPKAYKELYKKCKKL